MRHIGLLVAGVPAALLATVAVLSCRDDAAGPGRPVPARLALAPAFTSEFAQIVDVDRLRALLFRLEETTPVVDTVVDVTGDSVDIELQVMLLAPSERFVLFLALISPAGDTVFRAGPDTVTPTTGIGEPQPTSVTIRYTGVGFDAAGVRILTPDTSVFFGGSLLIEAEAVDDEGAPIPGTPIAFASLDPSRADFPDPASGQLQAGSQRGTARVVAELLTGPADTGIVLVQPVPSQLVVVAGQGQTGTPGLPLASPIRVEARAADGLGVQGIVIRFATPDGGGFTPDSTMTDATGEVQTVWTLGPAEGTQTGVAAAPDFSLQVPFTADAMAIITPQTIAWVNPAGGNWSDAANWDAGRVPTSQDTAVIALSGTYTVTLDQGATVAALTVGGASGTQTLDVGTNTLTLLGDGGVGPNGVLSLSGGTLSGSTLTVGGTLLATGAVISTVSAPITLTGVLDLQGLSLDLSGGGTLGGVANLSGELFLQSGAFTLADGFTASGSGALVLAGATATVGSSSTVTLTFFVQTGGVLDGTGTVNVTGTLEWLGGTQTDAGITSLQSGSANLLGGALLTLTGGRTLENAGTLIWSATGGSTMASGQAAVFRILPGGVFQVGLQPTDNAVFDDGEGGTAPLLDNQGITQVLAGTFVVNGTLMHAQGATLGGVGTLDLSGATYGTLDGDIAPGLTPGAFTIMGDLRQGSTSTLILELNGTTPGTEYDQLSVSGVAQLDGNIDIQVSGFTPGPGDTFSVLSFGSRAGMIASVTGDNLGNGAFLDTVPSATAIQLSVASPTFSFTQEPTNVLPHLPITPGVVVEALDGRGNPFTAFAGNVTIAIGNDPSPTGATLGGTTTMAASGGVATFPDLTIDALASGFTLTASATDFVTSESNGFDVVPGIVWIGDSLAGAGPSGVFAIEPLPEDRSVITSEGPTSDGSSRNVRPRWSPDRSRITYSARAVSTDQNQLHVAELGSGTIAHLTSLGDTSTFNPRYNTDGRHVAFVCGDGSEFNTQDVCVVTGVDAPVSMLGGIGDGAGKVFVTDAVSTTLTGSGAFAWDPTNPDELAVVRDTSVSQVVSKIYVVTFDGTVVDSSAPIISAASDSLQVFYLDWSPDGSFLVFSGESPANSVRSIYRINRSDGTITQLTTPPIGEDDERPVISPDGSQVLFIRNDFAAEGSTWSYWRVPSDGSAAETQITPSVSLFGFSNEVGHDWSPDGTEIVVVDPNDAGSSVEVFAAPSTVDQSSYPSLRRRISSDTGVDRTDGQPNWRP